MKILEITALLVVIAVFFLSALSTLPNFAKAVLVIGSLFISGAIIARITNSKNHHGLVIVRGKYGFGLMKSIADKHPKAVNALADLGLSLGFGAIYSYYLFKKRPKKLAMHLVILAVLFLTASFTTNTSVNPLVLQAGGFLLGLAGIGLISVALNAFAILTIPETPAGVMPVVPGITVPWEAIFAIAIIAIVHETAHGVLFFIEKLKVKHSGILLLGFLPIGAFVEPDEKQFKKHEAHGRRRILVAGSASNFYTVFALLPLAAIMFSLISSMSTGMAITNITPASPADGLLANGDVLTGINGVATHNLAALVEQLQAAGPNGEVILQLANGETVSTQLDQEGKLGIEITSYTHPGNAVPFYILSFLSEVLRWAIILSLALAIINLLPLFITDGHHLITDEATKLLGSEEQGRKATNALAVITLLLILLNMVPFVL
ncbi:site-2 protease family protein [Candidatus Micrarchaeota archaeon]|nr:site-2 protease family protein [Candidatus Micrarchaeota archaeon]